MRRLRRDRLTQDYDAHALFTFSVIPKWPRIANIAARLRRGLVIAFSETWLAVWLFRAKKRALAAHIPLLPVTLDAISRAITPSPAPTMRAMSIRRRSPARMPAEVVMKMM